MRFAICDDNREHIAILKDYFDEQSALSIETEPYESGEDLVRDYTENHQRYDALFIDMEMGGMNGIETANAIRDIDERVIIVFVTSHTKYAIESFQCEPLSFIVKPIQKSKIEKVIKVIAKKVLQKRSTISFYEGSEYIRLYCDDILYCNSEHNDVIIHTKDGTNFVRMTLSDLEKRLEPGMFFRIHRSFIVNLRYVKKCTKNNEIILYKCSDVLPLSRQNKKRFTEALIHLEERSFDS